jgi:hypothetical protein
MHQVRTYLKQVQVRQFTAIERYGGGWSKRLSASLVVLLM